MGPLQKIKVVALVVGGKATDFQNKRKKLAPSSEKTPKRSDQILEKKKIPKAVMTEGTARSWHTLYVDAL